jgi:hypothetical protein
MWFSSFFSLECGGASEAFTERCYADTDFQVNI